MFFALVMVAIGAVSSKRSRTMDGFILGGRNIGPWMSAFAYGTSYFSAVIFIGYAGKHGWDIGLGSMWIGVGNAVIGCWFAWKFLAPRVRRMTHTLKSRTMPEFFAERYLSKPMKLFSAIIIFIFLVPYAASVYKGLGVFFAAIFPNIDGVVLGMSANVLCMFIVAALTAVYLVMGGYVAVALNDFVQGIIMIGGVVVLAVAVTLNAHVGGISNAVSRLTEIKPSLTNIFGGDNWSFLMINILLTSVGTFGLPQMVHKFYAIKDQASIKRATVVSTAFALLIGCGAYYVGSMGRLVLENKLPDAGFDAVVPTMLISAFSGSIGGSILLAVILLLVLSASMSTLSSVVLSSSTAVTVDFVAELAPKVKEKSQMLLIRLLCLLFVALSFIFATFNFAIIVSLMSYSWGVVAGCFIGPFIWGLFSKRVTKAGAWAGMLGGIVTVAAMTIFSTAQNYGADTGLYDAFKLASKNSPTFGVCAMGVSLVIVPLVSLISKQFDQAHIKKAFAEAKD